MQPNIMQLVQMFRNGNPMQIAMGLLQQNSNNPIIQNVMSMMNNGNQSGIEQIARNMCKEKGINPDEMFNQIKQMR